MVRSFLLLTGLLLAGAVHAEIPLCLSGSGEAADPLTRDAFYCQDPDYDMVYGMSSGFDAEIADDIPEELAGEMIHQVTIWVGEWYGDWQDPLGVTINFYYSACPPDTAIDLSFMFPWNELETEHVHTGLATVYRVTATLPEPIEIVPPMSMGVHTVIDWGHDEPFCGICATPMYTSYGACVAYLDGEWWGYTRWTPIDHYTNIPQDLAYCLGGPTTAVDALGPIVMDARLQIFPNPFRASTTIQYDVTRDGPSSVRIFDAGGRVVTTLYGDDQSSGLRSIVWRGWDDHGRRVSPGVYFVRLESVGDDRATRLVAID